MNTRPTPRQQLAAPGMVIAPGACDGIGLTLKDGVLIREWQAASRLHRPWIRLSTVDGVVS